jgi:hypothetical protein
LSRRIILRFLPPRLVPSTVNPTDQKCSAAELAKAPGDGQGQARSGSVLI